MSVILFKDGGWKKFDEYSFLDRLKEGWSLSPDYPKAKEIKLETSEPSLDVMSKDELEDYARGFGIELDKRKSFPNMLKQFNELKAKQ